VAVNRTKVLEAAQKFLSKGQYDKAIAEYQKLVIEDPRDVRTLLKIGDLHTRRNKPKDAIDVYETVAELYAKQGFFLKAVAVHKQILKLDASHLSATLKLAQMYEELALSSDALTTYEQAADAYLARGETQKALQTMERMISLDGQNVAARIKYAEALSKADKAADAAVAFAEGARLLREQGRIDDYIRVVERQLYHDPDNVQIARELSGKYLERNDPKRALAKLQVCFKADPRDVQTLEMLAEAFRQLGQIPKTVSVLKEIARLHGEVGADDPRKRTLLRVLDLDPTDAEAKQALATIAATAKPAPRQSIQPDAHVSQAPGQRAGRPSSTDELALDDDDDLALLEDDEQSDGLLIVAEDSIAERAPEPAAASYSSISGLLIAAEGYESNGNYEQAEAALKNALLFDEENVDAHERLKDLYLASNRRVDAVRELLWLSKNWDTRDLERARSFARAAFELAPRAEATCSRLESLGLDPETGEPAAQTEDVMFVDDSLEDAAEEPSEYDQQEPSPFAHLASTHGERPSVRSQRPHLDAYGIESVDPLDIPFEPDDFEETAQARHDRVSDLDDDDVAALLDAPMSASDFDAPSGAAKALARGGYGDDANMVALLDSPISPYEFDASPPARRASHVPADLPGDPPDDFGLSDDRFERSDLHDVTPFPGVLPQSSPHSVAAADRPQLLVVDDDSYAELESEEFDVGPSDYTRERPASSDAPHSLAPPAAELLDSTRGDAANDQPGYASDVDEPNHTEVGSLPPLVNASEPPAPFTDYGTDAGFDSAEAPEPTVPAEPIPELIRRSSQRNLEPVQAKSTAPVTVPAPAQSAPVVSAVVAPAAEVMTPEIEETLDEAAFFASQSLLDEALEVVQEAILIYPGSAALRKRLLEYEAAADAQEEAAEQKKEDLAFDESFDIAEQLASELAEVPAESAHDDMVDVESVFAQFKKGVAQQIAEDDTDTHFDLGIAYKEMGLLDDAIAEFEVSARSPARACAALTMVGMCHVEKGDPIKAIGYFEKALNGSVRGQAEELALGYEIGNAYEAAGQMEKALSAFERVAARDRTFRGVGGRLDQLKRRGLSGGASRASR